MPAVFAPWASMPRRQLPPRQRSEQAWRTSGHGSAEAFVLVASFGIGAFIAATLQLRASQRAILVWPLLAEAVALVLFVALCTKHGASYLLTCAMGIQIASLTRVRGTRIRTTHLRSVWTDAGHDLAIAALAVRRACPASRAGDLTVASR